MPILGVVASQISGHLISPYSPTGSYDALAVYTVPSGGASSITFAGIPQSGYQHLQIRFSGLSSSNATLTLRFNGDTSSNYANHYLQGNGSAASAGADTTQSLINIYGALPAASATSQTGSAIIDVLDYLSTSKNKTVRTLAGYDSNGSGFILLNSGLWYKTPEAINSITLTPNAGNWTNTTQAALYGIRG